MFLLELWLLLTAFSVVSAINICMIMIGAITPFRIVMFFNVAVMLLEMLHWFFCWQYYKSSIEIKILMGLRVGDI
jgi:high-affinity Fe2+/Pb2+ permease